MRTATLPGSSAAVRAHPAPPGASVFPLDQRRSIHSRDKCGAERKMTVSPLFVKELYERLSMMGALPVVNVHLPVVSCCG